MGYVKVSGVKKKLCWTHTSLISCAAVIDRTYSASVGSPPEFLAN